MFTTLCSKSNKRSRVEECICYFMEVARVFKKISQQKESFIFNGTGVFSCIVYICVSLSVDSGVAVYWSPVHSTVFRQSDALQCAPPHIQYPVPTWHMAWLLQHY